MYLCCVSFMITYWGCRIHSMDFYLDSCFWTYSCSQKKMITEPVSRDQILRHGRGQGIIHFPCSDSWSRARLETLPGCDGHTYKEFYSNSCAVRHHIVPFPQWRWNPCNSRSGKYIAKRTARGWCRCEKVTTYLVSCTSCRKCRQNTIIW